MSRITKNPGNFSVASVSLFFSSRSSISKILVALGNLDIVTFQILVALGCYFHYSKFYRMKFSICRMLVFMSGSCLG